jgi:hypothetical protein
VDRRDLSPDGQLGEVGLGAVVEQPLVVLEVVFTAADLASGTYIYQVTAGGERATGKLLLQK